MLGLDETKNRLLKDGDALFGRAIRDILGSLPFVTKGRAHRTFDISIVNLSDYTLTPCFVQFQHGRMSSSSVSPGGYIAIDPDDPGEDHRSWPGQGAKEYEIIPGAGGCIASESKGFATGVEVR